MNTEHQQLSSNTSFRATSRNFRSDWLIINLRMRKCYYTVTVLTGQKKQFPKRLELVLPSDPAFVLNEKSWIKPKFVIGYSAITIYMRFYCTFCTYFPGELNNCWLATNLVEMTGNLVENRTGKTINMYIHMSAGP